MIYIYILIGIAVLFFYFIIKKSIKLQITWNEHKSYVFDIASKANAILTINNEIIRKQNKLINQIKSLEKKSNNIENKLNAIQYELLLNHVYKIKKEKKKKKKNK